MVTAWGDESIRIKCNPPVYLLAATYCMDKGELETASLQSLKPKGAHKLHWRDMSDKLKIGSIRAVASLKASHSIVIACNIASNKQERARRKCLETLLPQLEAQGIDMYAMESRGPEKDKLDIALLLCLRSRGQCTTIDMTHEKGCDDSRLWVPDQVLGAYGDLRSGIMDQKLGKAWNELSPSVNTVDVWL